MTCVKSVRPTSAASPVAVIQVAFLPRGLIHFHCRCGGTGKVPEAVGWIPTYDPTAVVWRMTLSTALCKAPWASICGGHGAHGRLIRQLRDRSEEMKAGPSSRKCSFRCTPGTGIPRTSSPRLSAPCGLIPRPPASATSQCFVVQAPGRLHAVEADESISRRCSGRSRSVRELPKHLSWSGRLPAHRWLIRHA